MKTTTKLLLAILFATLAVGQATAADQNKKEQKQSKKELRFLLDTVGRKTMTLDDGTVVYAAYFKDKKAHPMVDYRTWVQQRVKYPKGSAAKGKVRIEFVVEKDGSVTVFDVPFSADPALTEAVKDVLNRSPKWHPAVSLDGKEFYKIRYSLNLIFQY
ncbi:MAG: hypothetical protein IIV44_01695 [Rikenellaceae bacterium]|nr:hypothetical protein [Rikenellaceae bacterium]